jgi:hypothetical protein
MMNMGIMLQVSSALPANTGSVKEMDAGNRSGLIDCIMSAGNAGADSRFIDAIRQYLEQAVGEADGGKPDGQGEDAAASGIDFGWLMQMIHPEMTTLEAQAATGVLETDPAVGMATTNAATAVAEAGMIAGPPATGTPDYTGDALFQKVSTILEQMAAENGLRGVASDAGGEPGSSGMPDLPGDTTDSENLSLKRDTVQPEMRHATGQNPIDPMGGSLDADGGDVPEKTILATADPSSEREGKRVSANRPSMASTGQPVDPDPHIRTSRPDVSKPAIGDSTTLQTEQPTADAGTDGREFDGDLKDGRETPSAMRSVPQAPDTMEKPGSDPMSFDAFRPTPSSAAETTSNKPAITVASQSTLDNDVQRSVMDQIVQKAVVRAADGRSEMRIQLKPDVLGDVRLSIVSENQHVSVRMIADQTATKDIIESQLHHLKAELDRQGLIVERVEVLVDTNADPGNQRDNFFHMFKHHGSASNRGERFGDDQNGHPGQDADDHPRQTPRRSDQQGLSYFA